MSQTKKNPRRVVEFEAGKENRIVYGSIFTDCKGRLCIHRCLVCPQGEVGYLWSFFEGGMVSRMITPPGRTTFKKDYSKKDYPTLEGLLCRRTIPPWQWDRASGRYACYWNAFLFQQCCLVHLFSVTFLIKKIVSYCMHFYLLSTVNAKIIRSPLKKVSSRNASSLFMANDKTR